MTTYVRTVETVDTDMEYIDAALLYVMFRAEANDEHLTRDEMIERMNELSMEDQIEVSKIARMM